MISKFIKQSWISFKIIALLPLGLLAMLGSLISSVIEALTALPFVVLVLILTFIDFYVLGNKSGDNE